eukprot:COSAG01_NODE_2266_length_8042_cov_5.402493_7_plen_53_part_00
MHQQWSMVCARETIDTILYLFHMMVNGVCTRNYRYNTLHVHLFHMVVLRTIA